MTLLVPGRRRGWLCLAVSGLFLLALARSGSAHTEVEATQVLARPGPANQPTQVAIGLYLLDLTKIDDAAQTLTVNFVLWLRWHDPRLADESAGKRKLRLSDVWNPRIQVGNERSLERKLPDLVEVDAEGGVIYVQRMSGTISSAANLADFPFDTQVFEIQAFVGGFTREEVDLVIEPGRTGRSGRLSVLDWDVGPLTSETFPLEYAADGRVFSGCRFAFEATRHTGFYLWKVILPLVIVVLMSWAVFWIDPSAMGAQIGVATTSILALIAYQFVLGDLVPRLAYLTRQDRFLVGSMILVLLAMVEVIATSAFASQERLELAKRIDRWSRIAFPMAFLFLILIAFRW